MSKVGDTLTVTVEPDDAVVSYQWYADGEEIEDATDDELLITPDMVGSKISVAVMDADGNSDLSDETEEVGVYDELEILSAEQTGQYTAEVTFSAPISADDKLEVTKGGNKVEFKRAIDSDKLGAELTFTDALTTGTYTVTLTPADTKVKASSVTFEAKRAELSEIRFLNDVLVMKDHYYNEGYAYVKGYDQFGNEKLLSGLNVVSGVGTFKSYDSDTGKITIKDDTVKEKETGAFLTIKEVPVFVQYQEGTNVISANKTLTVSTRAYVDELEFGEIKKNSTEQAKRLTLDELSSGLYYVEILDAKDQYGNALSADDLQDQVEDKVLFVIPGDTGAFYTTGKFTELNGKTVLWLEDNDKNAKPGKMDLSITGAGGKTFKKEAVEIFDNPYINELTVDYPDLYEGMTESKQLNFSAIDQYGDDVNLWDFRPVSNNDGGLTNVGGTTLVFGDQNAMTTRRTEIKISGGAEFNIVEVDTKAKTSKVTINVKGMDAKDMAVFTTTTAGTKVKTRTITIGERGKAAKVASSFPSTKKLDPGKDWNVNADVVFVDINGNKMTRNKNNKDYPYFLDGSTVFATVANGKAAKISDEALANDAVIDRYVWTLSEKKVTNATDAIAATAKYDADGKVNTGAVANDIAVDKDNPKDVYVTVYALSNNKYYIVDSASTRVSMIDGTVEKVEVVAPGKLYAAENSTDDETFKVKLTNKVGESWKDNASSIVVGGIFTGLDNGATLSGKLASDLPGDTTKTTPVSVYYGPSGSWEGGLVGTVDLTYSNVTPVPTTTKFKFAVDAIGDDGEEAGRVGVGFDGDLTDTEFVTAAGGATYAVDATGKLTIDNFNELEDNLTGWVVDQYDQPITGTVVYLNGTKVTDKMTVDAKRNVWEFKNDNQGKAFYVTEKKAGAKVSVAKVTDDIVPTSNEALADAIATATDRTIVVGQDLTLDTTNGAVTLNTDLVVKSGATLTLKGTHAIGVADGKTLTFEDGSYLAAVETLALNGNTKNIVLGDMTISVAGGKTLTIDEATGGHVTIKNAAATQTTAAGKVTFTNSTVSSSTLVLQSGILILGAGVAGASGAALHVVNTTSDAKNLVVTDVATLNNIVSNSETATAAGKITADITGGAIATGLELAAGTDLTLATGTSLTSIPAESGVTVNGVEFTTSAEDMKVSADDTKAGTSAISATAKVEATEVATGKTTESTVGGSTGNVALADTASITTATQLTNALKETTALTITLDANITGFTGFVNPKADHTIDMNGHSVSGTGTMNIDDGKKITLKGTGTFGPAIEVWNTSAQFDWTSGSLKASVLATEAGVTTSSVEAVIAMWGETTVSPVPSLGNIAGPVSKLTVTAYNVFYTALTDAKATIGSGADNKTLTVTGKTVKNGTLSSEAGAATLTLPESFAGATVGTTTVRAGHNSTDYTALSWVISK